MMINPIECFGLLKLKPLLKWKSILYIIHILYHLTEQANVEFINVRVCIIKVKKKKNLKKNYYYIISIKLEKINTDFQRAYYDFYVVYIKKLCSTHKSYWFFI
jgi:hypothetical protein